MFSMVYKGQRRKIKIRTPWISTLSHEIHTEMKKLVFPAIKIDSLNLSHSLVIPHPSISLDSFSHTLLFIISFPSTYFSWFTLGFWNHLHVLLLNPLRSPHHLLLQILTSFPYHLLLLTPLPSWVPPSLTFADSPPWVPRSLTFTDSPLGSPKVTLGLSGTGNAVTVVQLLVATATDLLLDAGLWLAATDRGVG